MRRKRHAVKGISARISVIRSGPSRKLTFEGRAARRRTRRLSSVNSSSATRAATAEESATSRAAALLRIVPANG